jgi:HK97 family phage portal protein
LSFIDWLRSKLPNTRPVSAAPTINGTAPLYSVFGQSVFASDVVQAAIDCVAKEISKLDPRHIITLAGQSDPKAPATKTIQRVLDCPNDYMTTADFLSKVIWLLYLNWNAFVIPVWGERGKENEALLGLYPVSPSAVDIGPDPTGRLFITIRFASGYQVTLPYEDVIHLRLRYSENDFFGGNAFGLPDNKALLETLELNKKLLTGIARAMNAAGTVNGIVQYNTILDKGSIAESIKDINERLAKSEDGILPLDLKASYTAIKRDINYVDPDTVRFIDEKILRFIGVSLPILSGDYTPAQFEAFYSKTLEPRIISLTQAFTKALFTPRQRGFGNGIIFYPSAMVFMTTTEKLEFVRLAGDVGGLYVNEIRTIFGLAPLPELEGVRKVSLNYIDADLATSYQLGLIEPAEDPTTEPNTD